MAVAHFLPLEEPTLASLPNPLFCMATTAENAVPLMIGPLSDLWCLSCCGRDEAVGAEEAAGTGLRLGVAKLERVAREAIVWERESFGADSADSLGCA